MVLLLVTNSVEKTSSTVLHKLPNFSTHAQDIVDLQCARNKYIQTNIMEHQLFLFSFHDTFLLLSAVERTSSTALHKLPNFSAHGKDS